MMKLIFERSVPGRRMSLFPECDVEECLPEVPMREAPPRLPEVSENELDRHYTALAREARGLNDGFYPLGSCTMKHNPLLNERMAALEGFTGVHPLQPAETVTGCTEVIDTLEKYLKTITGMDRVTFQPAAGSQGEFTGLLLIRAYHEARGEGERNEILIPDSAHGTNPASAAMAGYRVVELVSDENGMINLEDLRQKAGPKTAGLMLTNPNTVGIFDTHIREITTIVHDAGGLCYYDGANLNAVIGLVRPGDIGFDVTHLNLHKTFSTPHGGGGPGAGPVACKSFLAEYLPGLRAVRGEAGSSDTWQYVREKHSIGNMTGFYGNFLILVRALCYLESLGRDGVPELAHNAVLNANYMMAKLKDIYPMAYDRICMHEFVMNLDSFREKAHVSALDVAKALLDFGIHPPTMYFPLIVPEALMVEPTETESRETLDGAIAAFRAIYEAMVKNPERVKATPATTPVRRLDEVTAARKPVLKYGFGGAE